MSVVEASSPRPCWVSTLASGPLGRILRQGAWTPCLKLRRWPAPLVNQQSHLVQFEGKSPPPGVTVRTKERSPEGGVQSLAGRPRQGNYYLRRLLDVGVGGFRGLERLIAVFLVHGAFQDIHGLVELTVD